MEQDIYLECAKRGYPYSCSCGESFASEAHAWGCRKCRTYLADDTVRKVYMTNLDGTYRECVRQGETPPSLDEEWLSDPDRMEAETEAWMAGYNPITGEKL